MLRSLLLAGLAAGAMTSVASAQEASGHDWTGFYVGGNIGTMSWDADGANAAPCAAACNYFLAVNAGAINDEGGFGSSDDAFNAGVQFGWNGQSGSILFGVEADLAMADVEQSVTEDIRYPSAPANGNIFTNTIEADWIATLRGRFGYVMPGWMAYATAGVALTEAELSTTVSEHAAGDTTCGLCGGGASSESDQLTGWTAGVGAEWALGAKWSMRLEYLYADFDTIEVSTQYTSAGDTDTITHEADLTTETFRLGVNWSF